METHRAPALNPAHLPPGTRVGDWIVVAWTGRGVHGAVYKAVPVDNPHATPVALKLALLPRDPRFAREVELHSCVRHPSVPRLWDHGEWLHPSGTPYPFLVMDWIAGTPLYEYARQHRVSSQQVLQWLAQLASALQSLHAQGCVHRDVKGDNVLVRHSDGRGLLTDFGSGRYPGASSLTPDILPPGTPAYRSPEAWLFSLQHFRDTRARYSAQPTDDLYSLGVTAYRLVTGQYPELAEPSQDETGTWHLQGLVSPAPLVLNLRVSPQLNALILRMLSVRPEARGTAAELAEALEHAAERTTPQSAQPLFSQETPSPSVLAQEIAATASMLRQPPQDSAEVRTSEPRESPVESFPPPMPAQPWRSWLMIAAVLLALAAWAWWSEPDKPVEQSSVAQKEEDRATEQDGGTTGLGEAASTTSRVDTPALSTPEIMADDTLPEPLPGQAQPDAKGRCPRKRQVALNGGCWGPLLLEREKCEDLNGQMFKGTCYVPILPRGRRPTSNPGSKP